MPEERNTFEGLRALARMLPALAFCLSLAFAALGVGEAVRQRGEDEYVRSVTQDVLRDAQATDTVSKAAALRDYLRTHVRNINFFARTRPFLRDTAADTLRTGKGRCGEATRAFVNMARSAGIPAQRLYLEGKKSHVVAVVSAEDGSSLIVDSADRPYFADVEPLGELPRHAEFSSYSTLGWRRLSALRKLPSNELSLGPLVYLFENPHALFACLWLLASASLLALAAALRRRLRRALPQNSKREFTVPAALEDGRAEV